MSDLTSFINNHVSVIIDNRIETPDIIDTFFLRIRVINNPDVTEFKNLIANFEGEFIDDIDFFDNHEHSYIEIGAWIGSQHYALAFMAIGVYLGLWDILTPNNLLPPDTPYDLKQEAAGRGFVFIISKGEKNE
jgi:hypothetical protein